MARTTKRSGDPSAKRASVKAIQGTRRTSVGSIALNFHEGSRSEILAEYLFSMWGTITRAPRQSDYGVDLYGTLTERVGQRGRVRDYFAAQVRSTSDPWQFNDPDSISWLIEYPTPLFLCTVDKKKGFVRIYHTLPRFEIWNLQPLPDNLELTPEEGNDGSFQPWMPGVSSSLSAPIIQAKLKDLTDEARMDALREVFTNWVRIDQENCNLVRQRLLMFRRPGKYRVNQSPSVNTEVSRMLPNLESLKPGLFRLAEAIAAIGGQLANLGHYALALDAALLLDRLQTDHGDVFKDNHFWSHRLPGWLGNIVNDRLNRALGSASYHYAGLDAAKTILADHPLIKRYIGQ